jgi:dihydroxyacetone kinase
MSEIVRGAAVVSALQRASRVLVDESDYFTSLDQAVGDGDMGITLAKIGNALRTYNDETEIDDIGQYLAKAGMTANRAGPSTIGTLLATALMRAGKAARGKTELRADDLVEMYRAAEQGIQERGKAQLGDKTLLDAVHPACEAFSAAVATGHTIGQAGEKSVRAAEEGRDGVTPLRSKVGRASWVGERTEGEVDPGCEMFTMVLKAVVNG